MKQVEKHHCHGGELSVWTHVSNVLGCEMTFSIFVPPQAKDKDVPCVTFLSGLTCTHDNFTSKAGAYAHAAKEGIIIVAPDTSPRGYDVPDDETSYDFGKGAGFYINATQAPWDKHYQMESYITQELNELICREFPILKDRQGIMGHSMGGHGALTLALKYPDIYKSISAFSPIVAPAQVAWGEKAFSGYLGNDKAEWNNHDATALILQRKAQVSNKSILIDQGLDDQFLSDQLKTELFKNACEKVGQKLQLRLHDDYDHSYYFIQSFIADHVRHHVDILTS
jgi:S-formylglutathione hydrolase